MATENVFNCCDKEIESGDFKNHLRDEHGMDGETLKGTRKMVLHLNIKNDYFSTYEWEMENGLKFMQYVKVPKHSLTTHR